MMASLRAVTGIGAAASSEPAAAAAAGNLSAAAVNDIKDEGNRLFKEGDLAGASAAYTRVIDACTTATAKGVQANDAVENPLQDVLAAAYCNRSMCRLKQQDYKGAETDSRAALRLQPNYPKALYRQALSLRLLGDYGAAAEALGRLLRLDPRNKEGAQLLQLLRETLKQKEQQQADSNMPSALLETALNADETETKRRQAFARLGQMVQQRETLQEAVAKEGLLQRLALFLKQQNGKTQAVPAAKATVAAEDDSADGLAKASPDIPAAAAVPASVEAAGWELLAALVQFSPLGLSDTDSSSKNRKSGQDHLLLSVDEPLVIPSRVRLCREALRNIWRSEDFLLAFRRLQKQGLLPPPSDSNGNVDSRHWRGLCCVCLLRAFAYLKQSEADSFEHDSSFLTAVAAALDCSEAPQLQVAALQALAAVADARRRLGLKAKALTLRHGIERSMEAALTLLSAATDAKECGTGSQEQQQQQKQQLLTLERNVELVVVSLFRLLGDRERAEADRVDIQRLADQLLAPFLSHCCSKNSSKQAETYVGLKALLFLMTADRDSARDFILQGSLLPHILSAATGEAAAGAGLAGTLQQQQQQQVGTALLLHCLDYVELRQKLLDEDGMNTILQLLRERDRGDPLTAKLAVALARVCVHSAAVRQEVLEQVDFTNLLQELLVQMLQKQQQKQQGLDNDLGVCVLELFFFLSLHAEFKDKLLHLGKSPDGQKDLIDTLLQVGSQFCNSSTDSSRKGSGSNSSLPRYLLCGGLCNLLRSREDKDRMRRRGSRGNPGGVDLDESQLEALEALYSSLPAEAKPVANGEVDLGDESNVRTLRELLLQRGAVKLLVRACTAKPLPSANVLLAAGKAFRLLAKNEKARGVMVREGALRALLTAIGALKGSPEDQQDLQQAAAQLCISVDPSLFSYSEALDAVPAVLPLLQHGHELLQYEGALALTNLLSVSEELRLRAFAGGAWRKLAELIFTDNDLLRAAALEGWCNLASSEKVQLDLGDKTEGNADVQDLKLLLAFCRETENKRAQQAAAGALATLLNNSKIAKALPTYSNYGNLLEALEEAEQDEGPLLDRLLACLFNIWAEEASTDEEKETKRQVFEAVNKHKDKLKGLAAKLAQQMLAANENSNHKPQVQDSTASAGNASN